MPENKIDERLSLIQCNTPSSRINSLLQNPEQTLCFCHSIPAKIVMEAIEHKKAKSVGEIGSQCNAGTDCGSCRSDIAALLRRKSGDYTNP